MTSEILNFAEKPIVDESVQEYEHHEYEPSENKPEQCWGNQHQHRAAGFIYASLRKLSRFRRTLDESQRYCVCKRRRRYSD